MGQTKYQQRRSKSESELKEEQFKDQMEDDLAQLEADITATKRAVRDLEQKLSTALSASPFSGPAVVELENKHDAMKRGLDRLVQLKQQEFSPIISTDKA